MATLKKIEPTPVQPMSAPTGKLIYMDVVYDEKTSSRSKMKRFKIRFTNTKGEFKTRNIKAVSEQKALAEITDLKEHHYTITESISIEDLPTEEVTDELYKIGDFVMCIKNGKSRGRGEPYYAGNLYKCSHTFLQGSDKTIGLKNYQNIVEASDFRKARPDEISKKK